MRLLSLMNSHGYLCAFHCLIRIWYIIELKLWSARQTATTLVSFAILPDDQYQKKRRRIRLYDDLIYEIG